MNNIQSIYYFLLENLEPFTVLSIIFGLLGRRIPTMSGNVPNVPSLKEEEQALLFEEAIQLKMAPYDFRVWNRYLFDKCDADKITCLVNLLWYLLNIQKVKAREIGAW